MTTDPLAANLCAYAAQVAAVVLGAGLALRAWRVTAPRTRLRCWRIVLIVCLALPVFEPWARPLPPSPALSAPAITVSVDERGDPIQSTRSLVVPTPAAPRPWMLTVLATGTLFRLIWLIVGFAALRRLRRHARVMDASSPPIGDAIALTGVAVECRLSDTIAEPVTFGARRPVVLLPARLAHDLTGAEQTAVVCHELLHVRRHDWLRTVADEIVRSVFWFHPAIWWLLDQVHLCREQIVDRLVVDLVGERQPYLNALWRLVAPGRSAVLRPASAFLGRAHLTARVALLVKEAPMSKLRLTFSLIATALAATLAGGAAVRAFPLYGGSLALPAVASAPVEQSKPTMPPPPPPRPGTVTTPLRREVVVRALRRTRDVTPVYPPTERPLERGVTVTLMIAIDTAGRVTDVIATSGADPWRQAAIDAARKWEFEHPPAPANVRYVVWFPAPTDTPFEITSRPANMPPPPPPPPRKPGDAGLMVRTTPISVTFENASLRDVLGFFSETGGIEVRSDGFMLDRSVSVNIKDVPFDTALRTILRRNGMDYRVMSDGAYQIVPSAGPVEPGDNPVRIGGNIPAPQKIVNVSPVYPPDAQAAHVQGIVIVEAVVGTDGKVKDARILRSIPALDQAALDAVRQWEYTPTLLNGAPVSVVLTTTVNFTLQ